jgi:hypothetical protein
VPREEIPNFRFRCDKDGRRQSADAQPQSRPSDAAKQENHPPVGQLFEG